MRYTIIICFIPMIDFLSVFPGYIYLYKILEVNLTKNIGKENTCQRLFCDKKWVWLH